MDVAKKEEIGQRNSNIAQLVGAKWYGERFRFENSPCHVEGLYWCIDELEYHLSWEWLMPVWEKVCELSKYTDYLEHLSCDNRIASNSCLIYIPDASQGYDFRNSCYYGPEKFKSNHQKETLIEAVWLAISDFAKWYISPEQIEERAKQKE